MAGSSLTPEGQLAMFRRATGLLASSRDFDEMMAHAIAAFLPGLGDFGIFDLVVGDAVQRQARAFEDPRIEGLLRTTRWVKQERADLNLCALSTGHPALHAVVDDAWYRKVATDDAHLQLLRELAFVSMISVPMRYQGELLGALTLFYGRSGRHFSEADLAFAIDLAALAAPVVANVRLIDQQRRTTEALRASEERFRVGLNAAKLGVWDWDIPSDRVIWSDFLYDLHGLTREEFGGRSADFETLVHPDDRERVGKAIETAITRGEPYTVEFRAPTPDGTVRWITTRAEVYRDASGTPVRMIGATFDVTERRVLLEETARARREAEAANRAKDDFLAMLGHELRNPLAPIVTALHLMDMRAPEPFRRERDVIERQVSHMVRLVDDLLDIARIARGKIALDRARLDLVALVEGAVEANRPALAGNRLSIELDAPTRPLFVDGDRVRLTQIVGNLLANAAKFSPPGERIIVHVRPAGDDVELAVEDHGAGIAPELLPRVFELFVQGPQELARERGGLGLGLAIVANLVALHGGRAAAESAGPGRGSTFRVTLPRAAAASEVERPAARAIEAPPLRVLVVDDNADAADLLGELLQVRGHDVRVVGTAPDALVALEQFPADVALLDIGLPGMDGYELARRIRERGAPNPCLIAMTGYGRPSDRERAREAGFDDHLVKPVDPSLLNARIVALTAGRR
jgi:PAS domain S-box-containing protein